jgi:thiamine biosynthesis lipoprotein
MNRRRFLATVAGAFGAVVLAPRLGSDDGPEPEGLVHHATWIMGQIANIWIHTDRQDLAAEAATQAFQTMRKVESTLSLFDPSSELRAFLEGPVGRTFGPSPSFREALGLATREWRRTHGAFDPSVVAGRGSIGPEAFLRGENLVRPNSEAFLDFGGIGCGIALDLAGQELRLMGVGRSLLELSGDFLALDPPRGSNGWPLAAADPWTGAPSEAWFDLVGGALATSATVERKSILDPRDGSFAERLAQVTLVAPTAVQADAWSTALVVRSLDHLGVSKAEFDRYGRLAVG